jgi:hypothetical protein
MISECMARPRDMHFIVPGRCNELLYVRTYSLTTAF